MVLVLGGEVALAELLEVSEAPVALVGRDEDWAGIWLGDCSISEDGADEEAPVLGLVSAVVAWELEVRDNEVLLGRGRLEVLSPGEPALFSPMSAKAVVKPFTCDGPGLVMG